MLKRIWKKWYLLILLIWLQIGAVTVWNCRTVIPSENSSWQNSMEIPQKKLKIEFPYYPAIPLLGISPDKTIIQKDTCIPVFIAAVLRIAKMWKQPKCLLVDEQIKKCSMCIYIYIHLLYLFIHLGLWYIHIHR